MFRFWAIWFAAVFLMIGCASKPKSQPAGALAAPPAPIAAVLFTGDVKMQSVPWSEGMTLAQALVNAHYTGLSDPRSITVTRNGTSYKVDVRRLLRDEENPELQPGDLIDVRR